MARRVFVHIGTRKSATTYLQQWGDVNRDVLAGAGVLWPELGAPFAAASDLFGRSGSVRDTAGAWRRLDDAFRRHDGDAVFSNELLAGARPRRINQLVAAFAPAEVHVLVTARDLARVVPSQWQTTLKNGKQLPWSQFVDAVCSDGRHPPAQGPQTGATEEDAGQWFWRRQDLPAIVHSWRRATGVQSVTLVTVPPAGSPPAVVGERFAAALGAGGLHLAQPEYANSSLGAHSAELIRRMNAQTAGWDRSYQRIGVRNGLSRLVLAQRASAEPRLSLNRDQAKWLSQRALVMVEQIQRLSVPVVGDLNDLVPDAESPAPGVDPAASTDGQLLEAAVSGLTGMAHLHAQMRMEYDLLLAEHDALLADHESLLRKRQGPRS